jgi:hypothetical protein
MKFASSLSGVSLKITRLSWARGDPVNGHRLRICFERNIIRGLMRWKSWRNIREVFPVHFPEDAFLA